MEIKSTAEGSKIVIQNLSYADRTNYRLIGLKIRTNGAGYIRVK